MGSGRDAHSDSTDLQSEHDDNPGSFFKKYKLLTADESGSSTEALFKRYAPARGDDEKLTNKPSEVVSIAVASSTTALTKWSKNPAYLPLWWGVASVLLILSGWMLFNTFLPGPEPAQRAASDPASPGADADPGAVAGALSNDAAPASTVEGASIEEEKDSTQSPQARRISISSPDVLLNMMQARAREFEDRGMLSLAEEQYRAVATTFPGDRFSQDGLSRVQAALLASRENEISRISRETGLKNFRMGDYAAAERELSAAVNAGRADTATLYALGMSYQKLGNAMQSKVILERCVGTSPDYAPALVGLANANVAAGRRDQALPLLRRALELGGGAEFTPARIGEMIARIDPEPAADATKNSAPASERSNPAFFAHAVHSHDLLLASCRGDLKIVNSVVHFNASTPSHSFHVLVSEVSGARVSRDTLYFNVNGRLHRFKLKERPPKDFLDALTIE